TQMRPCAAQDSRNQCGKWLAAELAGVNYLPGMPLVGSDSKFYIRKNHTGPEGNACKSWVNPDYLLPQAVHRLRRLLEGPAGIAMRIVAVVPQSIRPLERMARLHLKD